ncbi:MerC domain-containing protein [Cyclobacterium sp.]|uniref:MerC domain-containing protein n=1 Tax=Cyclobacterium sp. TaxID=1966343 RepID=UPI001984CDED|nr:MerC domain-containing protein [Cyclobacterium sp.]MBD3629292.1 MerC domain-containing protein [Cyclobacterium sp.]
MKNSFIGIHLDFIGFSASLTCAIHCAFLPFLVSGLPIAGMGFLDQPWIEHSVIILSFILAVFSLSHGYKRHHNNPMPIVLVSIGFLIIGFGLLWSPENLESFITPIGAVLVGAAHYVNWLKIRSSDVDFPDCENQAH